MIFQLTTSRRGRLVDGVLRSTYIDISTHDLTKRSTAVSNFMFDSQLHFNSRPHEEVDACCESYTMLCNDISTHDLTKRSTLHLLSIVYSVIFQLTTSRRGRRSCTSVNQYRNISTHDLTKRSTNTAVNAHRLCIFQLTTSRRGRHDMLTLFCT